MSDIVSNVGYSGQELTFLTKEAYCFISGKALCIYDINRGPREMIWRPNTGICCIASHIGNEYLALAPMKAGAEIELINFSTQETICALENPCDSEIINMEFSRDGTKLFAVSGISDQRLLCWSIKNSALLFSEVLKRHAKKLSINPADSNMIAFHGDQGLCIGTISEISGTYSVRFEWASIEADARDDYETSDDEKMAASALSNSIMFVKWMPFDFIVLGNRQGNVVEVKVEASSARVLRKHSMKTLTSASYKSFPTGAVIAAGGIFIVSTSTGSAYWFGMNGFSNCPSLEKTLVDVQHPLQISQCSGFVSSIIIDASSTKVVTGTRNGGLMQSPADVQERVFDADQAMDLEMSQSMMDQMNEPILIDASPICTFQEGAVLCSKSLLVPYDSKNSISVFVTGSHSGKLDIWRQPFFESEAVVSNTGVRRSAPRQCIQLFNTPVGLKGKETVITSLEVIPFRGKAGTSLLAVGTDKGWLELYEVSASLSEEDEDEGGDENVKVVAKKVASRRFYSTSINFISGTTFHSSVSITNLIALGSVLSDVVHVIEANNTLNGFGFDVRCTFKTTGSLATSCEFEEDKLYVGSADGYMHIFTTSTYSSGGPLAFPEPDSSFNLSRSTLSGAALLRGSEMIAIGFTAGATNFSSVELSSPDDLGDSNPHTSLVVCFSVSANGKFVATGCVDGSVYIWHQGKGGGLNKFVLLNKLDLHADAVVSITFSADSSLVFSCSIDGSIFISTVAENRQLKADIRPMKINERSSVDGMFNNLEQPANTLPWIVEKEANELAALKIEHTPDTDSILEALAQLSSKHKKLLYDNNARTEIEQLPHKEFVVDVAGRDSLVAVNEASADKLRLEYNNMNMWNELTAARVRNTAWDSMDMHSRVILPIVSENPFLAQHSMPVRKYTAAESDRLDKVRRMRCIEIRAQETHAEGITSKMPSGKSRVAWSTAVQGSPEITSWIALDGARWPCEDVVQMLNDKEAQEALDLAASKKAPTEQVDDEEEEQILIADDDEEEEKVKETLDESDIFNLLYPPQSCRTQVQKRTQILLLKEVSRIVCIKFNTHFEKLVGEKEEVIGAVEAKNARISVILSELQQQEVLFEPKWKTVELAGSAVTVFDSELTSAVYESEKERQKRLLVEEEARRREAEKSAENVQGRALMDMMNGVLSVKKDMLSEDALIRPEWMDEMDPKDMSELQLKELDEFDEKIRLIQEEQARYKKALELELKQLKQQSVDAIKSFDEKMVKMSKMKVLVKRELLTHELYISRLAFSMAKRDQTWASLKKNEQDIDSTKQQRSGIRAKMDTFNITVEDVKNRMNVAYEEGNTMEKGFNRNIQDLTGVTFDLESLKVFKNLFRKRNYESGDADEEELDQEESLDNGGTSKGSKNTSKGGKGSKNPKKVSANKAPGGSKAGKENLGPMQEAAKALNTEEGGQAHIEMDRNDPFYFALLQRDKAKKLELAEIPLLVPLNMDSDCPENFSVDQFTWSKLQDLRTERIEKEIEAKVLEMEYKELKATMDQLGSEDSILSSCINDLREMHEATSNELKYLETNLEAVICLKQGNDEVDKDAVVSNYDEGLMLPCSVVEKFNKKIKGHGKEKINVLSKIKQYRRKINIVDWNAKHLSMQAFHYEEYFTDLQLLRVTRDLQQVIRDGSNESQTKARLDKIAQRKDFLQKNSDAKIQKLRVFNETMRKNNKDKMAEMDKLNATINALKGDVAQRKSVQQSRNDAKGTTGDAGATATLKMKKVVQRRQLVDTARAQAEEIDYLRQELDKMRQRTFPSFAKAKKSGGH